MSNVKHISYYTNVMQNWSKPLGPKPSEAELALAHVFGRPGKQSFVVALALRGDGVTRGQMLEACSLFDGKPTPQLNHMRALVNAKMFTRLPVPGAYAIEKGPNAQRFIELHGTKAAEVDAKPAKKAKGKAKAKKATPVTVVETPTSVEAQPSEQPTA
jgi:hypothetical protein